MRLKNFTFFIIFLSSFLSSNLIFSIIDQDLQFFQETLNTSDFDKAKDFSIQDEKQKQALEDNSDKNKSSLEKIIFPQIYLYENNFSKTNKDFILNYVNILINKNSKNSFKKTKKPVEEKNIPQDNLYSLKTKKGFFILPKNVQNFSAVTVGRKTATVIKKEEKTNRPFFLPKGIFTDFFYAKLARDFNWEKDYLYSLRLYYEITKKLTFTFTAPFANIKTFTKAFLIFSLDPLIFEIVDFRINYKGVLNSYATLSYTAYSKIKDAKNFFIATISGGLELPTLSVERDISATDPQVIPLLVATNIPLFKSLGIIYRGVASFASNKWYSYTYLGGIKKLKYKNNKQGDYFALGFGVGPIITNTNSTIFRVVADFNFYDIKQSQFNGLPFGVARQAFFGGFSAFYSYKKFWLQAGIQIPIIENFSGYALNTKLYFAATAALIF